MLVHQKLNLKIKVLIVYLEIKRWENAKIYYNKALQIRDDLQKNFFKVFKDYNLIIGPTTARCAYDLGSNADDPLKSFLDDILVMHANMGGFPCISVPVGFKSENLPIGLQILGNNFDEATIYQLASFIEKKLDLDLEGGKVCE